MQAITTTPSVDLFHLVLPVVAGGITALWAEFRIRAERRRQEDAHSIEREEFWVKDAVKIRDQVREELRKDMETLRTDNTTLKNQLTFAHDRIRELETERRELTKRVAWCERELREHGLPTNGR